MGCEGTFATRGLSSACVFLTMLALGCDGDPPGTDAGAEVDASAPSDAGADAGPPEPDVVFPGTDVSASVERLGNPSMARYADPTLAYARNVWDLMAFEGRVYVGSGNSANTGPASNAGPVDVWVLDPTSDAVTMEGTLDEEQIDVYRVIDGSLVVPGHDPTDEGWELGNFYRLDAGAWAKVRTVPNAIHTYDMRVFEGRLYAALGAQMGGSPLVVSDDGGDTWAEVPVARPHPLRFHALFEHGGRLFGSSSNRGLYELADGTFTRSSHGLLADAPTSEPLAVRATLHGGELIYIVAENVNDHQWTPRALRVSGGAGDARMIVLPPGVVPWDIEVHGGALYVLGASGATITVMRTEDRSAWTEILRFDDATFARSFAIVDGDFYFGLGAEVEDVPAETGELLRVRASSL